MKKIIEFAVIYISFAMLLIAFYEINIGHFRSLDGLPKNDMINIP